MNTNHTLTGQSDWYGYARHGLDFERSREEASRGMASGDFALQVDENGKWMARSRRYADCSGRGMTIKEAIEELNRAVDSAKAADSGPHA